MNCSCSFVWMLAAALSAPSAILAQNPPPAAPKSSAPAIKKDSTPLGDRNRAEKIYLEGAKALEHDDLGTAKKDFERAASLDPDNQNYSVSVEIVRQHLATQLIQEADKARLLGQKDTWHARIKEAYLLDPHNPMVAQHIDELADDSVAGTKEDRPEEEIGSPPIHLDPLVTKNSFHLHASAPQLIRQVLAAYGIAPAVDTSVNTQTIRFDVDNVDFAQAAQMLRLATDTFFVPLDPKRVLVAQDTKENRVKYERQVMETVYLPGLTPTEMSDMGNIARNVFGAQQATVQPQGYTMTVRAPEPNLQALNSSLTEMLVGHSEVLLDVRVYEIDQSRTSNIGIQLPQQTTVFNVPSELNTVLQNNQALVQQIISSGLAAPGDYAAILGILIASGQLSSTILTQPFALFGGGLTLSGLVLGQVTGNFALNSSDTRSLDQVQLRVLDQEDATFRSGTRYPIVTSSYSSLTPSSLSIPGISNPGLSSTLANLGINLSALTSSAGQTIPQVQYEDLGLTLKATPHIQLNRDVDLKMDMKIESLTGQSLNGNPVLSNRQYSGIISLHPGASALLVSSLSRQQSAAISGLPGLSELPGFQSTTNQQAQYDTTNLVIIITPHILRMSHTSPTGRLMMMPPHG